MDVISKLQVTYKVAPQRSLSQTPADLLVTFCPKRLTSVFLWCIVSAAGGILVPQPGIESALPAVAVRNLSHWTTRKPLKFTFKLVGI